MIPVAPGQIHPGNLSNQRYETNLHLKKSFTKIRSIAPNKDVTEWRDVNKTPFMHSKSRYGERQRSRDQVISKENKKLSDKLAEIKSHSLKKEFYHSHTPTADIMSKTKPLTPGITMINGKPAIDCFSLENQMKVLHGFQRQEMLKQQRITLENKRMFHLLRKTETSYKADEYLADYHRHKQ